MLLALPVPQALLGVQEGPYHMRQVADQCAIHIWQAVDGIAGGRSQATGLVLVRAAASKQGQHQCVVPVGPRGGA